MKHTAFQIIEGKIDYAIVNAEKISFLLKNKIKPQHLPYTKIKN